MLRSSDDDVSTLGGLPQKWRPDDYSRSDDDTGSTSPPMAIGGALDVRTLPPDPRPEMPPPVPPPPPPVTGAGEATRALAPAQPTPEPPARPTSWPMTEQPSEVAEQSVQRILGSPGPHGAVGDVPYVEHTPRLEPPVERYKDLQ